MANHEDKKSTPRNENNGLEDFKVSEQAYYREMLCEKEWQNFLLFNAVSDDNRQALLNSVGIGRALEVMSLGPEEAIMYFELNMAHVSALMEYYNESDPGLMTLRIKTFGNESN